MATRALNQPLGSPKGNGEEKDPLEEAQKFTKQMAATSIIKATVAEAEAKADKAKAEAERAKMGGGQGSDSPFKMKGEIDFGKTDLQQQQVEAKAELAELRQQAERERQALGQENQQLRDKIHEQEIKTLQLTFQAQMEILTKAIESNKANQKTLLEQLSEVRETAKELGLAEPKVGGDAMVQVELKKLDFDHQVALRKLIREEKMSDRQFQLDLRRLDDERDARKAEIEQKKADREMWSKAPQVVGQAIAQGMLASEGSSSGVTSRAKKRYSVEAGVGDSGTISCPSCETEVAIGPTARKAVCAQCGTELSVKRLANQGEAPTGEE